MSQVVESEHVETAEAALPEPVVSNVNEFDYKPVPILAPLAVVLGLGSILAWWLLPALGIALLGFVVGGVAVRKISGSEGELGGLRLALIGFSLSTVLLVGGTAKHAFVIATEVPEGYTKIHFVNDISQYGIPKHRGNMLIPKPVADRVDTKIFLKGYMWQTEHKEGLTSFLLVKDNQVCCFGPGQIKPEDMVLVELKEGQTVDLMQSMVSVAGTFKVVQVKPGEEMPNNGAHPIVYRLEADFVERSKTSF